MGRRIEIAADRGLKRSVNGAVRRSCPYSPLVISEIV